MRNHLKSGDFRTTTPRACRTLAIVGSAYPRQLSTRRTRLRQDEVFGNHN